MLAEISKLKVAANKCKKEALKEGFSHLVLPGDLIDIHKISPEALQVIKRLNQAKYKAYLVGGGVRDLLLGKEPKDFDVVTNATPEQIKKAIKNSRIIGKRFRLVHCMFRHCIIEVATFRCSPSNDEFSSSVKSPEGMLVSDNRYGNSLDDDAKRRDYTINSLYYSPYERSIHDFHGGIHDLINGQIDIIGDPYVRFQEDPCRIIRAFRFAAKLGFTITKHTAEAIPKCLELLKLINHSRMFEEFNKLFLTGHGAKSFELLHKKKILQYLLLEHGSLMQTNFFYDFIYHSLENSDKRYAEGKSNMPHYLYATMLWPIVEELYKKMCKHDRFMTLDNKDIMKIAAQKILSRQCQITNIPIKFIEDITNIWLLQIDLEDEYFINNPEKLVWNEIFRAGLDFLGARGNFSPDLKYLYDQWLASYEFYVPPHMRSRRFVIQEQLKQNTENTRKNKKKINKFSVLSISLDKKKPKRGKKTIRTKQTSRNKTAS
ncbi:MAG: polynucleotide adenylyltransferase PcnB [Succinivibrionaceae bacterium]